MPNSRPFPYTSEGIDCGLLTPMRAPVIRALVFLLLLPCTVLPILAQQDTKPARVAVLLAAFPVESPEARQFQAGLRTLGYVEGRDVDIEWHSVEGDYSRLPSAISETLKNHPNVIVVEGTVAVLRVREASPAVPIVMAVVGDPLASGLVQSLSRPGGVTTGLSMMTSDIITKRLQLLKETIPSLKRVGVFWDPSIPWHESALIDLGRAAGELGIQITRIRVGDTNEFGRAFSEARRTRAQALFMMDSALLGRNGAELVRLAKDARLPVAFGRKELAQQGALLSYSADFGDLFRRSARYVDRILKGAKAGDLPVEQPTKFEFVLNLKTARELGIKLPESVVARADELIR